MAAKLHLAEDVLTLHPLLQHLESLVDIIVTNENLHASFLFNRSIDGCQLSKKGRGVPGPSSVLIGQKSMPPMPPPGIAVLCFLGTSATIASVVMSRPATEAAPCSAARTTLVGSMMPFDIMLTYSPDWAS